MLFGGRGYNGCVGGVCSLVAVCGMAFALWWQQVGWLLHFGGSKWAGLCYLVAEGSMDVWDEVCSLVAVMEWHLLFGGSRWDPLLFGDTFFYVT